MSIMPSPDMMAATLTHSDSAALVKIVPKVAGTKFV